MLAGKISLLFSYACLSNPHAIGYLRAGILLSFLHYIADQDTVILYSISSIILCIAITHQHITTISAGNILHSVKH